MNYKLEITYLGGACPVQADGTINGVPFYFRARGQRWQMAIGEDPVEISCGMKDGWYKEEPWGKEMFDAGLMSEETAKEIIERCAEEYEKQQMIEAGVVNEN